MINKNFFAISFFIVSLSAVSSCSDKTLPRDPCEYADRPVNISVLIENRISNAYNSCLAMRRQEAINAF